MMSNERDRKFLSWITWKDETKGNRRNLDEDARKRIGILWVLKNRYKYNNNTDRVCIAN